MDSHNHITIVISTRNAAAYIDKCLQSALRQVYPSFNVIFIDAESTDGTYEKAEKFTQEYDNLTCIRNEQRKYQGENIRIGTEMAPERAIIVTLDGDDWFPHRDVLTRVNEEYVKHDCWMSYGRYRESTGRDVSHLYNEYPKSVRENKTFRSHKWQGSHLRTFRRELFLKINPEDMKDPTTGDYVSMAPDLSFQFPMLEMCGADKSRFIPDILYVYNTENPLNESKVSQSEINRIEALLRGRPTYETLEKLYDDE